jgi:hypothetical protein
MKMKLKSTGSRLVVIFAIAIVASIFLSSYLTSGVPLWKTMRDPALVKQLQQFVALKDAQARAATNAMPPEISALFKYAQSGDWLALSNSYAKLTEPPPTSARGGIWEAVAKFVSDLKEKIGWSRRVAPRLPGTPWVAAQEVRGALEAFGEGDETYSAKFGRDIIAAIPPGSIYFGGTDPGRFIVTAMCHSQAAADPFFVLTQNALADGSYLDYLRRMYGDKICIPSETDAQTCFQTYVTDAAQRMQSGHLKPGEVVHQTAGRVQISGQVAVMEINGLLAKIIFDKNPGREFYVEESFPLDWMYPQLEPHGPIFKLDRQPVTALSDEVVQLDHDYWAKFVQPMIGDWLNDGTPATEVANFAEKTFGRHDFNGFKGDPRFIQNAYSHKSFSKLRSSIAGLYAWRADHAADAADKERMAREADFAFRQAWALSPDSPEAIYRYVNFLVDQKRFADALRVAQTAAKMPAMQGSDEGQLRELVEQIKQTQGQN